MLYICKVYVRITNLYCILHLFGRDFQPQALFLFHRQRLLHIASSPLSKHTFPAKPHHAAMHTEKHTFSTSKLIGYQNLQINPATFQVKQT